MKKQIFILIFLILLLIGLNYNFLDENLENFLENKREIGIVERVIDGDTIVINGTSVRLLGINSPERGEDYYLEAKTFLEDLILNKSVELECLKECEDKYDRLLKYVFIDGKNVNLELVENGFANVYYPSKRDSYSNKFYNAWESCDENLCEKSLDICSNCIELQEFDFENEIIIFYNKCDFDCDLNFWEIKDEGRKNFIFENFVLSKKGLVQVKVGEGVDNSTNLFWKDEDYVWTDSGDTLFLRDGNGKLVLHYMY